MEWTVEIHQIDVGRGDSALIVIKNRDKNKINWEEKKTVLIDCGLTKAAEHISNYIKQKTKDNKIDILILSHNHEDHIDGYLKTFTLDNQLKDSKKYNNRTQNRNNYTMPSIGTEILGLTTIDPDAPKMTCIENLKYTADSQPNNNENRSSLCFKLEFGLFKYYTGGDKDGDSEEDLSDTLKNIDFFKVAHHGSKASTSDKFLNNTRALAAFISAGQDGITKKHDHPTQDCIDRLYGNLNAPENTFMTSCVKNRTHVESDYQKKQEGIMRVAGECDDNDIIKVYGDLVLKIYSPESNELELNMKFQGAFVTYYDSGANGFVTQQYIKSE